MTASAFKDVSWAKGQPVDTDKLNTMSENSRYLYEHAPKLYYNAWGVQRDTGVKIASGVFTIPTSRAPSQFLACYFGSFFTVGCRPTIVMSLTSPKQGRMCLSNYGLSGLNSIPDHRGFMLRISATEMLDPKTNYFLHTMYCNWLAMGY